MPRGRRGRVSLGEQTKEGKIETPSRFFSYGCAILIQPTCNTLTETVLVLYAVGNIVALMSLILPRKEDALKVCAPAIVHKMMTVL